MLSSSFGKNLIVTIAGGSHDPEMSVQLRGLPLGISVNMDKVKELLQRRSPQVAVGGTSRIERDTPYFKDKGSLVEVDNILTSTASLEFVVKNQLYNSGDYDLNLPRPGHADFPAYLKYGDKINMNGGGPFSGRMTVMLCIAGGIAMEILSQFGITIGSQVLSIGQRKNRPFDSVDPHISPMSDEMADEILSAKKEKNSVGGIVEAFAIGLPCGLGGPMSDGAESTLSPILYAIPGVRGVEFGNGFASSFLMGSENNDDFISFDADRIKTATNHHGGILGGLTTGMPLITRVAFKPTPSIGKPQQTINLKTGKPQIFEIDGRHDSCIVPRTLPIVESAVALGVLDMLLPTLKRGSSSPQDSLTESRNAIDVIDDEILQLLKRRLSLSEKIAHHKIKYDIPIDNPSREDAILSKIDEKFQNIYREIFSTSKIIQSDLFLKKDKEGEK